MQTLWRYYDWIFLRHARWVLSFFAIVLSVMAVQIPSLRIDASLDSLILEGDAATAYARTIGNRYQGQDFLVLSYQRVRGSLFSDTGLAHLQKIVAELAQMPDVASINSILSVPLIESADMSFVQVARGNLPNLLSPNIDRQKAKQEFLTSPIYKDMLLAPEGNVTAIQVNIRRDQRYHDLLQRRQDMRILRREGQLDDEGFKRLKVAEREFRQYSDQLFARRGDLIRQVRSLRDRERGEATMFLGGIPMIADDITTFVRYDLYVFSAAVLAIITLILIVIFRRLRWVLLPLLICMTTAVFMLGLLVWLGWSLSVVSSNFVVLLLIVTLSMTVHLIVRYREFATAKPKDDQLDLVRHTVRFMLRPCTYMAATTITAFMSLLISGIRPVIDFGWVMTIGICCAFITVFALFPSMLVLLRRSPPQTDEKDLGTFTQYFAQFVERRGLMVIGLGVAIAIVSIVGITQMKVDNRFIDYFDDDTEIYRGMGVIDRKFGGTITMDIVITAPAIEEEDLGDDFGGGDTPLSYWFNRNGIGQVKAIHEYLESIPEVGKVLSLYTTYQLLHRIWGTDLSDLELAFAQRMISADLSGILLAPYLSETHRETRITLRAMETSHDLHHHELIEKIQHHLINDLGMAQENVRLTGALVLYDNVLQSLYRSQILTVGGVFLLIMAMFFICFWSLRLALLGVIPTVISAMAVLGFMGLTGMPLDIMTVTIAAIVIGMGVDNTIHYIYRFRHEHNQHGDYNAAMYRAHATIGHAMYYTTIIIICGFIIFVLSNFTPSVFFGILTAVAMLLALIGALVLLPELLCLFRPFERVIPRKPPAD